MGIKYISLAKRDNRRRNEVAGDELPAQPHGGRAESCGAGGDREAGADIRLLDLLRRGLQGL